MFNMSSLLLFSLLTALLLLLADDCSADRASKKKHDADCDKKSGRCGWTFQDAFCSHAKVPQQSTNNNTFFVAHDLRYRIHAFGIAHRTLYIFAAGALFSAPLGHPPFNASFGQSPFHLSNQLPNNFYRAYRIFNYNYATLVLELDQDWQLLMVGSNLQDSAKCCARLWHTQQVIRNRHHADRYEAPPGVFALAFNAFFGDNATVIEAAEYALDRIIAGQRFFFHVQVRLSPADGRTRLYRITHYQQEEGQFAFQVAEYVIYPAEKCAFANTTKSWYLERKDRLTEEQINQLLPTSSNWLAARFPVVMLKNGFIFEDTMYLSKLDYLEVYHFKQVDAKGGKFTITWKENIASEQVLSCRLFDTDNVQYHFTVTAGSAFLGLVIFLSLAVTVNKLNSGPSRRYLNMAGGQLVLLTGSMIYPAKQGKKAESKVRSESKLSKKNR